MSTGKGKKKLNLEEKWKNQPHRQAPVRLGEGVSFQRTEFWAKVLFTSSSKGTQSL